MKRNESGSTHSVAYRITGRCNKARAFWSAGSTLSQPLMPPQWGQWRKEVDREQVLGEGCYISPASFSFHCCFMWVLATTASSACICMHQTKSCKGIQACAKTPCGEEQMFNMLGTGNVSVGYCSPVMSKHKSTSSQAHGMQTAARGQQRVLCQ